MCVCVLLCVCAGCRHNGSITSRCGSIFDLMRLDCHRAERTASQVLCARPKGTKWITITTNLEEIERKSRKIEKEKEKQVKNKSTLIRIVDWCVWTERRHVVHTHNADIYPTVWCVQLYTEIKMNVPRLKTDGYRSHNFHIQRGIYTLHTALYLWANTFLFYFFFFFKWTKLRMIHESEQLLNLQAYLESQVDGMHPQLPLPAIPPNDRPNNKRKRIMYTRSLFRCYIGWMPCCMESGSDGMKITDHINFT